jgi:hypothetical protein
MKNILALIILSANISFAEIKFDGSMNYYRQDNNKITSSNAVEHIFKLYEDRKYIVSVSNAINIDVDCFNNAIKETNVFTTLKIEF